jgi:K+-transporting ATPase ATPase C chain
MSAFLRGIKKPLMVAAVFLVICGLIYPLLLTGIGRIAFPRQAGGSLILVDGRAVGSELVGQDFTDARFMKGRPSAVRYNTYTQADVESGTYTGVGSGSKNYAPTNPELAKRVEADLAAFLRANPSVRAEEIPADLLTASGSGLDPHISPAAAAVQIPALAEATGLSREALEAIVRKNTGGKFLGVFGEETVNVLKVNLEIAGELGLLGGEQS